MVGFSDHEKLEALFKRVDLDGNGTLDFCEFMCLLYLWNDKVEQKWPKCVQYIVSSFAPYLLVSDITITHCHTPKQMCQRATLTRGARRCAGKLRAFFLASDQCSSCQQGFHGYGEGNGTLYTK